MVVCGERKEDRYRVDPTIDAGIRAEEASRYPPRVQDRSSGPEKCGTVRNECGGDAFPLLAPALRVATAVVKAVNGDDWREPFQNGPSDYERYQAEKAKRDRGSRVQVVFGAGVRR